MENVSGKTDKRLFGYKWAGLAVLLLAGALIVPSPSYAARPLVTDDTGTVGKGKMQVELGAEVFSWRDTVEGVRVKEKGTEASGVFTYGVLENVDVVAGCPYAWGKVQEDGVTVFNENGILDTSLEMKWRFYEKDGFVLALKPGVTLPTGNHKKGFGAGRVTYGLTFIATKEIEPFAFHFNAGYTRNENRVEERKNIWAASLAGEYAVTKTLRLVGNVGLERNAAPASNTAPAFALGGLIYAINDTISLDVGVKVGLNKAEVDHSIIAGITITL